MQFLCFNTQRCSSSHTNKMNLSDQLYASKRVHKPVSGWQYVQCIVKSSLKAAFWLGTTSTQPSLPKHSEPL